MANILASLFVIVCLCWPVFARVLTEPTVNETYAVLAASKIFPALPIVVLGSANEKCRMDSQLLLDNLRNATTWAAQMLDASAKSVQGLYTGNFYQLGNFDECVMTEVPIQAQFCLATLRIQPPVAQPVNQDADIFYSPFGSIWNKIGHYGDRAKAARNVVHYAMCIPASCSHSDLETSITRHLAATSSNNTISVDVKPNLCQTNREQESLSSGSIAYCIVIATFVLLVMVSTICDNNTYSLVGDKPQQEAKIECDTSDGYVQCFSLKKNLFELNKYSKSSLGSVYGIKFLSTCGVILAHRALLTQTGILQNYEYNEKNKALFGCALYSQTEVIVNSFFLISGILVTFVMLRHLEKNTINPIQMIIYRFLRLTPVYAVVTFFPATLMFHLGDGPLWTATLAPERQYCIQNWWTNLLYVNNYVNDDKMCMIHCWYMAPEFHYYIISVFLVLLIHKHRMCGYVAFGLTTLASLLVPFAITYIYKIDPVQFFYHGDLAAGRAQPYLRFMYFKSHVHATPYLVGVATGLLLHRLRHRDLQYTWQSTLGVAAGLLISFCSLIPGALMINLTWDYSDVTAALEQPQRRLLWPLGIAIVIISLTFSKNSKVNKFLSSPMMCFLSKLCYSAYLASFCLQLIDHAGMRSPEEWAIMVGMRRGISDICLSFAAAFVLYLTVEAPMDNLTMKLLKRNRLKCKISHKTILSLKEMDR